MTGLPDYAAAREQMVREQIVGRGLTNPQLLAAFRRVPRELFVAEGLGEQAYADRPLPIEAGQTISQPFMVACMIDAAGVSVDHHVLEIGAGSGYAAAVVSRIAATVTAVERHPELARLAAARMRRLGYDNVRIEEGDGTLGAPGGGRFEAILVAAAGRHVPAALCDQLAIGGTMIIPIGAPGEVQHMMRIVRNGVNDFRREQLQPVRFVPLIGGAGWDADR